jgi:hypothetical protein
MSALNTVFENFADLVSARWSSKNWRPQIFKFDKQSRGIDLSGLVLKSHPALGTESVKIDSVHSARREMHHTASMLGIVRISI